jgi:hypothetical protein
VRPIEIATLGQKHEFSATHFILQKWIFIVAFDGISLVLNVFIEILVKYYLNSKRLIFLIVFGFS